MCGLEYNEEDIKAYAKPADDCLLCNKKFEWHEAIIGKPNDGAWFCMECSDKYEDKTEYRGIDQWCVIEYEPNTELIFIKKT